MLFLGLKLADVEDVRMLDLVGCSGERSVNLNEMLCTCHWKICFVCFFPQHIRKFYCNSQCSTTMHNSFYALLLNPCSQSSQIQFVGCCAQLCIVFKCYTLDCLAREREGSFSIFWLLQQKQKRNTTMLPRVRCEQLTKQAIEVYKASGLGLQYIAC